MTDREKKLMQSLMNLYKNHNEIIIDEDGHIKGSLDKDFLTISNFIFSQTETLAEENVRKEWEELGYKWIKYNNSDILLINGFKDIRFKQCAKEVLLGNIYEGMIFLTMKEITLIDKTRKMLGWKNE